MLIGLVVFSVLWVVRRESFSHKISSPGLFVGILCIAKRGFQFRSFDSLSHSASSQKEQRISIGSHGYKDEELGEKAREAKQRLDHKLRRTSKEERVNDVENGQVESNTLQKNSEMLRLKQNGIKTFSRVVKQWKDSEKYECTICLDQFKVGDNLMHLQCDHKFHSCCLVPWLENHAYCPCCRVEIVT
nr:PREDICTED: RING finger protein 165-like [Nicotiana tabacum]